MLVCKTCGWDNILYECTVNKTLKHNAFKRVQQYLKYTKTLNFDIIIYDYAI